MGRGTGSQRGGARGDWEEGLSEGRARGVWEGGQGRGEQGEAGGGGENHKIKGGLSRVGQAKGRGVGMTWVCGCSASKAFALCLP